MVVTEIWRYPVKSIGGERLDSTAVTELGIEFDRGWGVFDPATSTVLTGRREPRLLLATASVSGGRLSIKIDTGQVIDGPIGPGTDEGADPEGDPGSNSGFDATDGRAAMSDALSDWLGYRVELRRAGASGGTYEAPLDVGTEQDWVAWTGPPGAWHDSTRTRVSILASAETGGIDPRRFRANLIIGAADADRDDDRDGGAGQPEPISTAGWVGSEVQIGSVADGVGLRVGKEIDRCVMVGRAQVGLPTDVDAIRWVIRERAKMMGVGALVTTPGQCAVGDPIGPSESSPAESGPS